MNKENYKIIIDNEELKNPFFSIIMLTYNACDLVESALKSIYNQTIIDFELILINDSSNDDTDTIVNENIDYRLKYIKNNRNEGVGKSRDLGVNIAKGKYIVFVDIDDIVDKDLLLNLKEEIDKYYTDFIIYGFEERYVDKNKVLWSTNRLPYEALYEYYKKCNRELENNNVLEDTIFFNDRETKEGILIYLENFTILGYPWNKCYKKQIIKDNNIHFENINIYEDIFFNLDYYKYIKNIVLLNKVLYIYNNKHNNKSLTKKDYDNYFELSKERINRVYELSKEYNKLDINTLSILKRIYIRYAYSELNRCINRKWTKAQILSRFDKIRNNKLFENILSGLSTSKNDNNIEEKISFNKIMQDCFVKKKKEKVIFLAKIINFVSKYLYVLYLKLSK